MGYIPAESVQQVQNQNKIINEREVTTAILKKVNAMQESKSIVIAPNYIPSNALQSAYLEIAQNPDLAPFLRSTPGTAEYNSLCQTLLDMVVLGLNPGKKQCYFINYKNRMKLFKSYFGDVAACINSGLIKDIWATVIYEGDNPVEEVVNGQRIISKHETKFGNENNQILGAYATITLLDGTKKYEVMTMAEIKKAWEQSTTKNSSYQNNFPQEACKRTVIRRAVKMIMNTSNDSSSLANVEAYNRTTADEYDNTQTKTENVINLKAEEITEKAFNKPLFVNQNTGEVKNTSQAPQAPFKNVSQVTANVQNKVRQENFDNYEQEEYDPDDDIDLEPLDEQADEFFDKL